MPEGAIDHLSASQREPVRHQHVSHVARHFQHGAVDRPPHVSAAVGRRCSQLDGLDWRIVAPSRLHDLDRRANVREAERPRTFVGNDRLALQIAQRARKVVAHVVVHAPLARRTHVPGRARSSELELLAIARERDLFDFVGPEREKVKVGKPCEGDGERLHHALRHARCYLRAGLGAQRDDILVVTRAGAAHVEHGARQRGIARDHRHANFVVCGGEREGRIGPRHEAFGTNVGERREQATEHVAIDARSPAALEHDGPAAPRRDDEPTRAARPFEHELGEARRQVGNDRLASVGVVRARELGDEIARHDREARIRHLRIRCARRRCRGSANRQTVREPTHPERDARSRCIEPHRVLVDGVGWQSALGGSEFEHAECLVDRGLIGELVALQIVERVAGVVRALADAQGLALVLEDEIRDFGAAKSRKEVVLAGVGLARGDAPSVEPVEVTSEYDRQEKNRDRHRVAARESERHGRSFPASCEALLARPPVVLRRR